MTIRVRVAHGVLEGIVQGGINTFLGIPFAAPPIGALRWREPKPPDLWTGVREAKVFGAHAMQTVGGEGGRRSTRMSEDCLTLNVWTATLDPAAKQPVMLWIHGGGNIGGSGSENMYDGARLAKKGVLAVTFNYRLGAFGFLSHPDLGSNFGVLDQLAAMEWVRDNIRQFGGDPDCVTLYGQSAGAVGVRTMLQTPRARGLFHRAIIQSAGFEAPAVAAAWSCERVEAATEKLFARFGTCSPQELREIPSEALRVASHELSGIFPPFGQVHTPANLVWMPVPDGKLVTEGFGGWSDEVPILFGCVENEARLFVRPEREYNWDLVSNMARVLCGIRANEVVHLLQRTGLTAYEALDKLFSTAIWFEPAYAMAERFLALQRKRFFYYHFARVSPGARRSNCLVMHSSEIRYHFDTLGIAEEATPTAQLRKEDVKMDVPSAGYYEGTDELIAQGLQDAWIAFARHGVPHSPDGTPWPAFTKPQPKMTWIENRFETRPYVADELLLAINSLRE